MNAIAAMTGVDPDELKIALGEHGDIWPRSIYGDVIAAHWEHEEKLKAMGSHGEFKHLLSRSGPRARGAPHARSHGINI